MVTMERWSVHGRVLADAATESLRCRRLRPQGRRVHGRVSQVLLQSLLPKDRSQVLHMDGTINVTEEVEESDFDRLFSDIKIMMLMI